MLPATSLFDGISAPKARRTVEIEEATSAATSRLFKKKVTVEQNCLGPRQPRICPIRCVPNGFESFQSPDQ